MTSFLYTIEIYVYASFITRRHKSTGLYVKNISKIYFISFKINKLIEIEEKLNYRIIRKLKNVLATLANPSSDSADSKNKLITVSETRCFKKITQL